MSARGESLQGTKHSEPERILGHVARFVVERCTVPVLLTPPGYREVVPWERLIVPMSGSFACDDALALAAQLASALDVSVKVVHVANPSTTDEGLDVRARYSDAIHHEYAGQLDELVMRGLPLLPIEQRHRIESVSLRSGEVLDRLVEIVNGARDGAVVVGWQGTLELGPCSVAEGIDWSNHEPLAPRKATGAPAIAAEHRRGVRLMQSISLLRYAALRSLHCTHLR